MAINSSDIVDQLVSHAKKTGLFDRVLKHEPKNKPGRGLTYSVWVDRIDPARSRSGLASTTCRLALIGRIYTNMLQEPQDGIDDRVMKATDRMFEAYSSDFTLEGEAAFIDLMGATQSHPLSAESGYINIDNFVYRVMTIRIPVIVNDAWPQSA